MISRKTRKHPQGWVKSEQINYLIIKPGRLHIMQETKHHKPTTFTQVCALHLMPKTIMSKQYNKELRIFHIHYTYINVFQYVKLTWYTEATNYSKKTCILSY